MEKKQTAVEWLQEAVSLHLTLEQRFQFEGLFQQCLEMEKEQHGETWDAALIHVDKRGGVILRALVDFDDYWADKSKTLL
jgi:hypothetical protein